MNDEKVLNLTDVDNDDFEAIKEAIEDWKASGLAGKFTFVSVEKSLETVETLKYLAQKSYNRGVWHGGFALIGGIVTGTMIYCTIEHFVTKKKKEYE